MSQDLYRAVLLFGAPGSGKGTQGKAIGTLPGFFHFSTGDMFRSIDPHTQLGQTFKHYSTRGELVPDDVTVGAWKQYVHAQTVLGIYHPHRELLLLDGVPRNVNQAALMDEHIEVIGVVHLVVRDIESMVQRLKGRALKEGRPDDAKEDVIRRRFEVYEQETSPVLAHYSKDLIGEVDAIGTIPGVLSDILRFLDPIQQAAFA